MNMVSYASLGRLIALSRCLFILSLSMHSSKEGDMDRLAIENGRRNVQGQTKG